MSSRYVVPRLWLASATLARTGDEMAAPALLLGLGAAAQSAALPALAVSMLTLGCAVGGPVVGVALDRSARPARLIALATAWVALGLLVLALSEGAPAWLLLLTALAAGTGTPAVLGGWTAQLAATVPPAHLGRAATVDATSYNAAGIAGPLLVALVAATASAALVVPAAALVLGAGALAAWWLARGAVPVVRPAKAEHAGRALRDTLRTLAGVPSLRRVTIASTLGHLGVGMAFVATPLVAVASGGTVASTGVLLAAMSAGAFAGIALASHGRAPAEAKVGIGTTVVGLAFLAAAVAPSWPVLLALFLLAGAAEGLLFTAVLVIRNADAPASTRGGVHTTAASLKLGAFAVGSAIAGLIGDGQVVMIGAAAAHALGPLLILAAVRRRAPGTADDQPTSSAVS